MDPMRTPSPRLLAVLAVLVSAAVGAVTNLITNRWNWTLAAVLAVLLAASAALAAQTTGARRGDWTRIRQKATGHSRIDHSGIKAKDASITQTARRKGTITGSPIDAHDADVAQTAAAADITDSPIDSDS
jgi:uncharacterized membrane protein YdbT with pleckstrin-like domain